MTLDSPPGITRPSTAASSIGSADELDVGAEVREHARVLTDVALQREDADARTGVLTCDYQPRSASRCGAARSDTLMPTIASPRPRETSAMTLASS